MGVNNSWLASGCSTWENNKCQSPLVLLLSILATYCRNNIIIAVTYKYFVESATPCWLSNILIQRHMIKPQYDSEDNLYLLSGAPSGENRLICQWLNGARCLEMRGAKCLDLGKRFDHLSLQWFDFSIHDTAIDKKYFSIGPLMFLIRQ